MSKQERVALVTGGATGIGRACCLRLAEQGIAVAVNYSRSEVEAKQTAEEIGGRGGRAMICRANVADDEAVRKMVAAVEDELGGLDILVNNAGTTHFVEHKDLDGLSGEMWDEILGVNLKGTFFCSRAAIGCMKRRGGGAIVNVASVAGIAGAGSSIAYAASKGGMITLTKSLARAFAPEIRVNAVAPGPVETRWLVGHEDMVERALAVTPMKRAASPEDIADAVVFLATGTSLMTGQCLVVDGGRTM